MPGVSSFISARPLAERPFRRLWLGQSLSAIGDQMFPVAIAFLALGYDNGPSVLGYVLAARVLATSIFLTLGGVLADRWRRTWIMAGADTVRCVAITAFALAPGRPPAWTLAMLTFVLGAAEAFFKPAFGALVPSLLPASLLQRGNAITSITERGATVIGPMLAGVLVATVGVRVALFADSLTFLVSLATLVAIREPAQGRRSRGSLIGDVRGGVHAVVSRPWIAVMVASANLQLVFAVAPTLVLLPVLARSRLGGIGSYSVILTLFGLGSLLGALGASVWEPRQPGVAALLAMLPLSLAMLSLVALRSLALVALAFALAGFGIRIFSVLWITALQRDVPAALLGRVMALDRLGSMALMPIAFAAAGPAAEMFGASAVLGVGSAVVLVTSLLPLAVAGVAELATPPDPRTAGTEEDLETVDRNGPVSGARENSVADPQDP